MHVIGHQTVAHQADVKAFGLLGDQVQVNAAIEVFLENRFAVNAAVGEMVRDFRQHRPRHSGHATKTVAATLETSQETQKRVGRPQVFRRRASLPRCDSEATASDAGLIEKSDDQHLAYAAARGCVLYTFNVSDFYRLHTEWINARRENAGMILAP